MELRDGHSLEIRIILLIDCLYVRGWWQVRSGACKGRKDHRVRFLKKRQTFNLIVPT